MSVTSPTRSTSTIILKPKEHSSSMFFGVVPTDCTVEHTRYGINACYAAWLAAVTKPHADLHPLYPGVATNGGPGRAVAGDSAGLGAELLAAAHRRQAWSSISGQQDSTLCLTSADCAACSVGLASIGELPMCEHLMA